MVREASAVVLQSGVLQIVVVIKRGFSSHPLGGTVELIRQGEVDLGDAVASKEEREGADVDDGMVQLSSREFLSRDLLYSFV
jgi:hypothetical protein